MFGWKSTKTRFIEFLQAQVTREQEAARHWMAVSEAWEAEAKRQSDFLTESQGLCEELIKRMGERPAATDKTPHAPAPRSVADLCRSLTERSRKGAIAKGRNLVAEMPPPGANPHGGN